MIEKLHQSGFAVGNPELPASSLDELCSTAFDGGGPGSRCLLGVPSVRSAAVRLYDWLIRSGAIETRGVAVQAIAFDKRDGTNWKVTWHQDLLFPFAERVREAGFELQCVKAGVHYARPPRTILEGMLAVRVHLDDCDENNGPLRVAPGSHLEGVIPSNMIGDRVHALGDVTVCAKRGETILMRPLTLHASSKAAVPRHRRVLHFVFSNQTLPAALWHSSVGLDGMNR